MASKGHIKTASLGQQPTTSGNFKTLELHLPNSQSAHESKTQQKYQSELEQQTVESLDCSVEASQTSLKLDLNLHKSNHKKGKELTQEGILELHEALIDLYLDVKVRSNDEIENLDDLMLAKERQKLIETEPIILIEYIKTSIEILLNLKMDTSVSLSSSAIHHQHQQQQANKTDSSQLLDNSELTHASNFTPNGHLTSTINPTIGNSITKGPPKAYEEMLQKLENDIRNHIRLEQQMKIAMENLQTKLDDKDRERARLKTEFKQYIMELKQDKKRYVELLELRDNEMDKLNAHLKKATEDERKTREQIAQMERVIQEYRRASRNSPQQQSNERQGSSRLSIISPNMNRDNSFLKKAQNQNSLSKSRQGSSSRMSQQQQQQKSSPRINQMYQSTISELKSNHRAKTSTQILQSSIENLKPKGVSTEQQTKQSIKQQFLQAKSQFQLKAIAASQADLFAHRKTNSSNVQKGSAGAIASMKNQTSNNAKSSERLQSHAKLAKISLPSTQTSTTLTVSLNNSNGQPTILSQNGLLTQKIILNKDMIPIASNDDSFGKICILANEMKNNGDRTLRDLDTQIHSQSMRPSSHNSSCSQGFKRSKENIKQISKLISSKRQAAGSQTKLATTLTDVTLMGRQSLGVGLQAAASSNNSRVLSSSCSISNLDKGHHANMHSTSSTSNLYNKLFLTQRKQ